MLPQEIIRKKRDGLELGPGEIREFVEGMTCGKISEGQVAAFAMAVLWRGMSLSERITLTEAMRDSGEVLHWDLDGPVVDKHSTGGVGDCVSLVLGPVIAACGLYVPMISGRGLGHTGGTLDKLEAIPGYRTSPGEGLFREVVRSAGVAIIGQTAELAPADQRMYAVRDVTATVESIDLLTASILAKKLAAGLECLVMDVKTGNGAFMTTYDDSSKLAESIVGVANGAGVKTSALITDMNEPLAASAGNAVEVMECVRLLRGDVEGGRLRKVTIALAGELLTLAGIEEARKRVEEALASGAAAERFGAMVSALGGPADFMEAAEGHLAEAPVVRDVLAPRDGHVQAIDTRSLGLAVVELGGGRRRATDEVDPAVGLTALAGVGSPAGPGIPLCRVHARTESDWENAARRVVAAYTIAAEPATGREEVLGAVRC
jgi:thymidine phosphorylase